MILTEPATTIATLYSADDNNIEISTLRLSSTILSLVSPVFKSMLDPSKGFKESLLKANGMKEIRITAFPEKSTIVAMNILHYQPESLPRPTKVSSRELHNLASFADYYQCQRFLEFWAPIWAISTWRIRSPSKNTTRWLWIGISFQIAQITKDCAQEVFGRMKLQGRRFVVDGKYILTSPGTNGRNAFNNSRREPNHRIVILRMSPKRILSLESVM
ncbi:hypothetical protein TWF506_008115 [Arthrobotrys conoides]|uniref:BTB domain-containing protein n=1 Tax=Arthrobotrys conoides TaxID=74498 RepID=A0AAN8NDY7_9PEZI